MYQSYNFMNVILLPMFFFDADTFFRAHKFIMLATFVAFFRMESVFIFMWFQMLFFKIFILIVTCFLNRIWQKAPSGQKSEIKRIPIKHIVISTKLLFNIKKKLLTCHLKNPVEVFLDNIRVYHHTYHSLCWTV